MVEINWDRVSRAVERDQHRMIWKPYGVPIVLDLKHSAFHDGEISTPWEIPQKLIVSVAITGAFFQPGQNPHQPVTVDAIRDSAIECASEGASTIHIHVRDDQSYNVLDRKRFADVIEPLRRAYPDLAVDGCLVPALAGEWEAMLEMLDSGLLDAAPINTTATFIGDSLFAKSPAIVMEKTRLVLEAGLLPEIAVYTDGDVSNADRYLFRSGLLSSDALWLILPALPGCSPMENPRQMIDGLTRTASAIYDVDPGATILVCAAGRASSYLATLAATMGLHVRVGMEDTYWRWPHRPDRLSSNLEALNFGKQLADLLGRDVATHRQYREMVGLPVSERVL